MELPLQKPDTEPAPLPKEEASNSGWLGPLLFCICLMQCLSLAWYLPDRSHQTRPASVNHFLTSNPQYPARLLKQQLADNVSVHCDIDAEGHAHSCHVTQGHYMEFNQTALLYAERAIYHPALQNGKAVPSPDFKLHINFIIE